MSLRLPIAAFMALALVLSGAPGLAAAPVAPDVTQVDSITVTAGADVRLTVAVAGDVGPDVVVTSAPIGLNCGGALFQYTPRENRQCWLWVRRNRPVVLAAQGLGRFGVDWSVQWVGCEPLANGAACQATPAAETEVTAIFSRTGR